jgi:hypothetical protein
VQVRAGWLVVGLAAIAALAWWSTRATPEQARARQQRAAHAAAEIAEESRPALYRWRDAEGVLQLTSQPPVGRKFERIDIDTPPPAARSDRE